MILDTTTKSLEIDLSTAATTNNMVVSADYVDITTTTTVPGSSDTASNGTTAVTIVAAPAASTQRKVNLLNIYNADTAAKIVTIQLNNNSTLRSLIVVTLQVGDTLGYTDTSGWYVNDANGNRKQLAGGVVDLTTAQTIAGVKTFSSPVGVAAAVASGDAVRLEDSGTFNWNCSEFTVAQDYAVNYYKIGKVAFITPTGVGITGTSNSVNKTLTGLPVALRPIVDIIVKLSARDNGGALVSASMAITPAGVVTVYSSENGDAFTASGSCKLIIPPTSWITA